MYDARGFIKTLRAYPKIYLLKEGTKMKFFEMKLDEQRNVLLEIMPEITIVMNELVNTSNAKRDSVVTNRAEDKEKSAIILGLEVVNDVINIILVNRYDSIVNILAALDATTAKKLKSEKSIFDLGDMILDALSNERLMRFFPQLRLLAKRTQSAI